EYQVRAHFEWNEHRPELTGDRNEAKHHIIAKRMLERGGRQDIFLGTRDCQGYVEPCKFDSGTSPYEGEGEIAFGLMFHGFDYPDEIGEDKLYARLTRSKMINGKIVFERPQNCSVRKFVRDMSKKTFSKDRNLLGVEIEETRLEA
ncbi:MAG: type I-C CRISPR-associated protein Cas5, partial [Bdellovibrionales bacterium]|nr:type I-C CRISPR-associated protein Cas5 [Bdellovibrionales bacterium]